MPDPKHSCSPEQKVLLKNMLNALSPFKTLRPTMPLQYVTAFMCVALNEGENVTWYAQELDISQSLMTRHLADLGTVNRYHEEGFGLIEGYDDLMDRRNRLMRLTSKGRNLVGHIARAHAR
jgi:DNA-binding MarR family transcriptional regulator